MQQAWLVYWKKWAAKHEYEELKEGIWLEPGCGIAAQENKRRLVRKASQGGQKIAFGMKVRCRRSFLTLVGRMRVNAKLVTRRKVQKSMGSTIAQNGTRSEGRFQRLSVSGSKKRELKRRSGSGLEVLSSILSVKANGTGAISP